MLGRHAAILPLSTLRQLDPKRPAIERVGLARDQTLLFEHVGDSSDISARNHEALRQLAHFEPFGTALKLSHEIESRRGGSKSRLQQLAQLVFDELCAGQEPEPEAQRLVMVFGYARFRVWFGQCGRLGFSHAAIVAQQLPSQECLLCRQPPESLFGGRVCHA